MTELEALRQHVSRGTIRLGVHIRKMNSPGSPVYHQWENVWPLGSLLVLSLAGIVLVHFYLGAAILLGGTLWWIMTFQPKVKEGVFQRTAALALASETNFDGLWANEILTLYAALPDGTERVATRKDDWRAFVRDMPG